MRYRFLSWPFWKPSYQRSKRPVIPSDSHRFPTINGVWFRIADRMTNTKFNQRQEVMALSFANFFSGFFGGMPGTAALVRTALNIKSGATSRLSGIICSVTVTVLALLLLPYFKFLPLPNIASIVVLAAFQMLDVEELQLIYSSTVR